MSDVSATAVAVTDTSRAALHGREAELAAIDGAASRAGDGIPQVVLVVGAAGIGRSRLLDATADRLTGAGARVVRVSGDEDERTLTFGVVDQLLGGFGAGPMDLGDPTAGGALLLVAWVAAAAGGLLAVLIDDAQWVDAASLLAMTFALRRLAPASGVTVIACRDAGDAEDPLPTGLRRLANGATGRTLTLGPLSHDAVAHLLREAGLHRLAPGQVDRIRDHSEGNPLHALALVRELDPAVFEGDAREPLPAPRSIAALVQARVAGLSADAEALVVAAAVLGARCSLGMAGALAEVVATDGAAAEAQRRELLEIVVGPGDAELRFGHATTRSAIYHGINPDRIVALHRRAAGLVDDDDAIALRHRLLGAPGADEAVAADADRMAESLAQGGAWFEAASWLDAALRVSSSARSRERRLLTAELYRNYGGAPPSLPLDPSSGSSADHPLRYLLAGGAAVKDSRFADGELLLQTAWDLVDPSVEPDTAARIAVRMSDALQGQMRTAEALAWAKAGLAVLPTGHALLGEDPVTEVVFGLAVSGQMVEALAVVDAHLPADAPTHGHGLQGRGMVRLWSDDLSGAFEDFSACAERARRLGPPHRCVTAQFLLSEALYRQGRWDSAAGHAAEALSLERELEIGQLLALALAYSAHVPAARGAWDEASAFLDEAAEILVLRGSYQALGAVWLARARLAMAKGDHTGVLDALSTIAALAPSMPESDADTILPWRLLYTVALVGAGRLDEAEGHCARLADLAERTGAPSTAASAARGRGLLAGARGDLEAAGEQLATASARFAAIPMPFEAAQADLDHGTLLARAGGKAEATGRLRDARRAFAHLRAVPFVDRCDAELARLAGLSKAEAGVADLVVAGHTNKEVAAHLHVSVRTVEDHLGHIYTKLGVSSRTLLGA
jgi:DNA-binding CsgD family transcriptional regulator